MNTIFDQPLSGFTFVTTQRGDTLQIIAARVFGDASDWQQLIAYNNLVYPWITDDPNEAGPGVLLTGAQILVPAASAAAAAPDPSLVFGSDIALLNGMLSADASGDFAIVSGLDNLRQGLVNVMGTPKGSLIFHGNYGSLIKSLIGRVSNAASTVLAALYGESAVLSDQRIASVTSSTATVNGDATSVVVVAVPIAGPPVTVTANL